MTADIKLLPLPELASERVFGAKWDDFDMQDYARANVAHATAAKDAEIERLRALLLETCDDGDEADADLLATLERARTAETRAKRLAEALRGALEAVHGALQDAHQNAEQECCGRSVGMHDCCGAPETVWTPEDQAVMDKLGPIERLLSSALRDHDQEEK